VPGSWISSCAVMSSRPEQRRLLPLRSGGIAAPLQRVPRHRSYTWAMGFPSFTLCIILNPSFRAERPDLLFRAAFRRVEPRREESLLGSLAPLFSASSVTSAQSFSLSLPPPQPVILSASSARRISALAFCLPTIRAPPSFTLTLLHFPSFSSFPSGLFRSIPHLYSFDHVPPVCYVAFGRKIYAFLRGYRHFSVLRHFHRQHLRYHRANRLGRSCRPRYTSLLLARFLGAHFPEAGHLRTHSARKRPIPENLPRHQRRRQSARPRLRGFAFRQRLRRRLS